MFISYFTQTQYLPFITNLFVTDKFGRYDLTKIQKGFKFNQISLEVGNFGQF